MIREYMGHYRGRVIKNILVKMIGTLCEIVLPAILAYMVDEIVLTGDVPAIIRWGIIMVVFSIGAWILNIAANRMAARTVSLAVKNIRQDLFTRILHLSSSQIDELSLSSLESRLTSDTYVIHRFMGASLRMGVRASMLFLGGVFFCFFLSWQLALILVLLIPPLALVIRLIFNKGVPLFHQVQNRLDEMIQVIRETIRGVKVAKALDKIQYEKDRYQESNLALKNAEIKAIDRMAMMSPMVNIILYAGLSVVLLIGANLAREGVIQAGVIIAFMTYFIQITNSLIALNRMFNIYNRAVASSTRIDRVIKAEIDTSQMVDEAKKTPLPQSDPQVPEVEFKDVSFTYPKAKNNIKNISFKLFPGETLGIMGATGSGKSTLVRLLLRQYDVSEGEVLIRGVNVKHIDQEELSDFFGIVFQQDFLFGGTVRENVAFGRELSYEQLMEATEYAQATEFLEQKDGGLDHILASKGVNLSGGQKQRLLLSRAFAGQPEILILDDSSSALDFRTDAKLRQAIDDHFEGTTTIIIAQRVSTVRQAEQIIFLENGEILALGNHEYLLEHCEPYREIAEMQMGEQTWQKTS